MGDAQKPFARFLARMNLQPTGKKKREPPALLPTSPSPSPPPPLVVEPAGLADLLRAISVLRSGHYDAVADHFQSFTDQHYTLEHHDHAFNEIGRGGPANEHQLPRNFDNGIDFVLRAARDIAESSDELVGLLIRGVEDLIEIRKGLIDKGDEFLRETEELEHAAERMTQYRVEENELRASSQT